MEKKNIVILGGGFGGLRVAMLIAKALRRGQLTEKYDLVLIDRNNAQTYTPVLYRLAAAASMDHTAVPKNITLSIPALINRLPIRFVNGEVADIDLINGDIHLATGEEVKAEFLVITLGSEANYFGIAGMKEHAIPLKTFADAQKINAALAALLSANPTPHIVVGGAGANGIELASQIKFLHPQCNVTLIEAMPTILPGLDGRVAARVQKRLQKLGVNIMTDSKIAAVEEKAVQLASTPGATIPFDLMVWTGGIKAPDMLGKLPLRAERGRPLAEPMMACVPQAPDLKLYPMVYVLGDSVCFHDPVTGHPLPATAPVAMAQAEIVAENVMKEITAAERGIAARTETYLPVQYPYVIPAGGTWAAAKVGKLVITGWPAHAFEKIVELNYLLSVMPLTKAIATWI